MKQETGNEREVAHWTVTNEFLCLNGIPTHHLEDLTRASALTVPPSNKEWRRTAPNLVVHPAFGDGIALAVDDSHVIVDFGGGTEVREVHRGNVLGPVGPQRVSPEDWDWARNKRRVRVFKRKFPKPPVILPICEWLDNYWMTHTQIMRFEHEAYGALARGAKPEEFDRIYEQLAKATQPKDEPEVKERLSARKKALLDSI